MSFAIYSNQPFDVKEGGCYHVLIRDYKKFALSNAMAWLELLTGKQPDFKLADQHWFRDFFGWDLVDMKVCTSKNKAEKERALECQAMLKSFVLQKLAEHTLLFMGEKAVSPKILKVSKRR